MARRANKTLSMMIISHTFPWHETNTSLGRKRPSYSTLRESPALHESQRQCGPEPTLLHVMPLYSIPKCMVPLGQAPRVLELSVRAEGDKPRALPSIRRYTLRLYTLPRLGLISNPPRACPYPGAPYVVRTHPLARGESFENTWEEADEPSART